MRQAGWDGLHVLPRIIGQVIWKSSASLPASRLPPPLSTKLTFSLLPAYCGIPSLTKCVLRTDVRSGAFWREPLWASLGEAGARSPVVKLTGNELVNIQIVAPCCQELLALAPSRCPGRKSSTWRLPPLPLLSTTDSLRLLGQSTIGGHFLPANRPRTHLEGCPRP